MKTNQNLLAILAAILLLASCNQQISSDQAVETAVMEIKFKTQIVAQAMETISAEIELTPTLPIIATITPIDKIYITNVRTKLDGCYTKLTEFLEGNKAVVENNLVFFDPDWKNFMANNLVGITTNCGNLGKDKDGEVPVWFEETNQWLTLASDEFRLMAMNYTNGIDNINPYAIEEAEKNYVRGMEYIDKAYDCLIKLAPDGSN